MNLRTGESAPVQAARMFIVPITLFSCASRGEVTSESTTRRVSITVSISAARTIRWISECWFETRTNSVRSSSRDGIAVVDPDDRLDLGKALERLREAAAPVGGEAGDEDAPGLAHPNQTDFRVASISCRFSWIRARISWDTVWMSARSDAGSAPIARVSIGSRKRSLNFAGR